MKLTFPSKIILNAVVTLTTVLTMSCTSDDGEADFDKDAYVAIPDVDFELILINEGIDSDGEINQQLLRADAEKVTTLDLNSTPNTQISDLTGIKGFVNLTKLSASQHIIDSIDLSANVKLDTIYLNGNRISSIDLSNNPNLVLVEILANELHTIKGLSKMTQLKELNLSFNNFEELNIQNEAVEVLHMSNNLLKSIGTNEAISLKNILLTSNKITNVDFSTNTLLETVLISDNRIKNIDLTQNSNLTHLYISSNSLTNLDVGNNQGLVELKADRNPDLSCIKIESGQEIPSVTTSDYQNINNICQ